MPMIRLVTRRPFNACAIGASNSAEANTVTFVLPSSDCGTQLVPYRLSNYLRLNPTAHFNFSIQVTSWFASALETPRSLFAGIGTLPHEPEPPFNTRLTRNLLSFEEYRLAMTLNAGPNLRAFMS
jgi:hypothetical protein